MTEEEKILWKKIKYFEFDDAESGLTFSGRLARENNWSLEYALLVIYEYKKFMFLICMSEEPLTPSDEVDQVWHLHLLYTKLYWEEFCKNTIEKEIHHGPTKGGGDEKLKFTDWYARTFELYKKYFHHKPPEDIWKPSEIRFKEINFTRVNRHRNWIIPKFFKWKI
jgi:hypothetical protein